MNKYLVKLASDDQSPNAFKGMINSAWQRHQIARQMGADNDYTFGDDVGRTAEGWLRQAGRGMVHGMGGAVAGGLAGGAVGLVGGPAGSLVGATLGGALGYGTGLVHGQYTSSKNMGQEVIDDIKAKRLKEDLTALEAYKAQAAAPALSKQAGAYGYLPAIAAIATPAAALGGMAYFNDDPSVGVAKGALAGAALGAGILGGKHLYDVARRKKTVPPTIIPNLGHV